MKATGAALDKGTELLFVMFAIHLPTRSLGCHHEHSGDHNAWVTFTFLRSGQCQILHCAWLAAVQGYSSLK